ncbi:hypothetical protein LTR62_000746 [Meristemomyces frigidus]|uniref:Uncharacterized protein n=1 Tax=Meristemomyces frigidus TaxID=1508187 RepID=A0AAN7YLE1_9PEZI|nr:hypothetical protein LTR62_000746 [Meristemomyces frigidus]
MDSSPETPPIDYDSNPEWCKKPLTPAQLLVNDIRLERFRSDRDPLLEVVERPTSSLVPETAAFVSPASYTRAAQAASNAIERQRFTTLEAGYGWLRHLRVLQHQHSEYDDEDAAKCRWVHVSSKFPEYLSGFLWGFSDDPTIVAECLRTLDHTIQEQTRFSKHGKYFTPLFRCLRSQSGGSAAEQYPMLISIPFCDWTILGSTPPLRFQVDRREGFRSSKSTAHLLRSVLQHFYRLEDTTDRESLQVSAKHKPWTTDRDLDLQVRQWYGHYPTAMNVDELWVLAVDAEHIVTFSSNQTWKSRWPPLQLSSRISDVAFRNIRNAFYSDGTYHDDEYTAMTHASPCLSGAVGMLHRNFWPDMVLCLTDRYAGYLSQLQYRLHRSPSTKLVMDLMACQEELNIVIQITQQQLDMIGSLRSSLSAKKQITEVVPSPQSPHASHAAAPDNVGGYSSARDRATYRPLSLSQNSDPLSQLLDNLSRELIDLTDLRDNADRLVTRTIQLVNIRLEDHGKAILVFTIVTIIFLPLNFVSSFFGMNVYDIRTLAATQSLFWMVAICVTVGVLGLSVFLAFSGGDIVERVGLWRDRRRERGISRQTLRRQMGS